MECTVIDSAEANQIINDRKPLGKFVVINPLVQGFIGLDNSTGDAWLEEFPNIVDCMMWLSGKEGKNEMAEKMTLEKILRKYFGCQKPVLRHPIHGEQQRRYLTISGESAYSQLVGLLYDLEKLLPEAVYANDAIEVLDDIAEGYDYGLSDDE